MKYLIIISCLIIECCTNEINRDKNKNEINQDKNKIIAKIEVINKKFLCIIIENNTNDKIYIPDCIDLPWGMNLFRIEKNNKFIDNSDDAKSLSWDFNIKEYRKILKNEKYRISYHKDPFLDADCLDSIAYSVIKKIKNRNERLLNDTRIEVFNNLKGLVFIDPGKNFKHRFYIYEDLTYNRLAIYYSYPYFFPYIKKGIGSYNDKDLKFERKRLDSLSFDYPGYINGYKLYNKVIISDPIIIER